MRINRTEAAELARIIHRLGHHMGMLGLTGNVDGYSPEIEECLTLLQKAGIPVDMDGLPIQALADAHGKSSAG